MKWFLTALALVSLVALGISSCGPERAFCPTTNPDKSDLTCHDNLDAQGTGMGGQNQGPCDGASYFLCNNGTVKQCTPCTTP